MPRSARALQLAALAATAGAAWSGWHHHWPAFWILLYMAFLLAFLAAGRNHHHNRIVRARHEQARRAARLDDDTLAEVPAPCCQIWKHSDGQAHGPDCTRPPLARRDTYRLTPGEQHAFEEITAGFDDRSAA